MNEEEFLQKIKEIKVNVPDEQFFLEYNAVVYNILEENQQLKDLIVEKNNQLKDMRSQHTDYTQVNILKMKLETSKKARKNNKKNNN